MEFRILGPLEVVDNGAAIDLGGQKQRALLAMLLLHPNEVVSTDRLIDALWEDDPPARAQKALQVYVSGLRGVIGPGRIETKAPGYLMRAREEELDAARFEAFVAQGAFRNALALWRGPALGDFAYARFAATEIARLEDLRLGALEARIEQDLAGGRHAEVAGELEGLVREHPLRERLRGQLMLALYRSGRQAEALDAYQETRRVLSDELGLEPSRELRELQQAILKQDPALELPVEKQAHDEPVTPVEPPTSEPSTREVRKSVTVLVADLSPSVERLDAETLRRMASRCFDELRASFERYGGSVEQPIGGTVTAVYGIPVIHEDDALRALRAGDEARERIAALSEELESSWGARVAIRIGVATGEVVTGGASHSMGGPVSIAAALQQTAAQGDLLLDERTLRLAGAAIDVEHVGEQIRLVAVRSGVAQPGRLRSRMVGRERELRRLHDAFEQTVVDDVCHLFTVLGPAGVGKSRLVEEFLGDLVGEARVARGRCLPYGEGITYWPVVEVVKEVAGLDDTDSPEEAVAKLAETLSEGDDVEQVARRVAELIGLAEAAVGAEESLAAVRTLLETLARVEPLVVVFDDIHWGESTFLDLVEHLAGWTREAPILLVCLARPELIDIRDGWGGGTLNSTSIFLEPLSETESAELVGNLAGAELDESARHRIVHAAEGNPLFVEEMLALALEGDPGSELVVPPTIQALLAARLDRLGEEDRAVIERAAVQGKIFNEDAVVELSPAGVRTAVSSSLGSLLHKELIRSERATLGGRTYRFRHLLIRDAAYESIPKEARADLHDRFGRWLERAAGDRATEYEEIVGYHLEQAYWYRAELGPVDAQDPVARDAAERLGAAGRRAFIRNDAPAAMNLVSRAVALLPPDDPSRVELVPNVRAMQGMAGDLSWADRVLTQAVEAAATTGDRRLAATALVQRGLLRLFTDDNVTPRELFDVAERAIAVFEELGDDLGLARAWRLVAQAHYLDRNGAACVEASERALAYVRRASDRFEETEIVVWLAAAMCLGSTPAAAGARRCEELLEDLRGSTALEVSLLGALGYLQAIQNRIADSEASFARGRNLMDEVGEVIWIFWLWALLADPVSGERELEWATRLLETIGEKSHYSSNAAVLARTTYAQGRYDEAEELTRAAEEASRPNDVHGQIAWRSTRAKTLARRGEIEAGEELAREAIGFAEQSDFLDAHANALMDLAEVLLLGERHSEAAAAVASAIPLYERKGNLVWVGKAQELLEQLTS